MLKPSMIRPRGSLGFALAILFAVICFGGIVAVGTYQLLKPYADQHDHPVAAAPSSTRSSGENNATNSSGYFNASGTTTSYSVYSVNQVGGITAQTVTTFGDLPQYGDPRLADTRIASQADRQCFAHLASGHGLSGDIVLSSYAGACRLVFGWQAPERYQCVFDVGILDPATIGSVDRSGFYFTFEPSNALRHIRYSCSDATPVLHLSDPLTVSGNITLGG